MLKIIENYGQDLSRRVVMWLDLYLKASLGCSVDNGLREEKNGGRDIKREAAVRTQMRNNGGLDMVENWG